MRARPSLCVSLLLVFLSAAIAFAAAGQPDVSLVDLVNGDLKAFAPSDDQVTLARSASPAGVIVNIAPGKAAWPGIVLAAPAGHFWNFAAYGDIKAEITNTSKTKIAIAISVQNDKPWKDKASSDTTVGIAPGKTATITVVFGYSWDSPGYALDPKAISKVLIYTKKTAVPVSFRIDSLAASGTPGEKPTAAVEIARITPPGGVMVGPGVNVDLTKQVVTPGMPKGSATVGIAGGIDVNLASRNPEQIVTVRPNTGVWDLGDALEVKVTLKNGGDKPLTPAVRLDSKAGSTAPVAATEPIAPGQTVTITAPFFAPCILTGINGKTIEGSEYASDLTTGITILGGTNAAGGKVTIASIIADLPPTPALPTWLGKAPPPEALKGGTWTRTLDENFNGSTLDTGLWNTYMNYSAPDQIHLASAHAILIKDGTAIMRFSKTPTHEFDDPANRLAAYQSAWLDTYGKWRQRYGYFECRVKAPTGPDMFPAFWLMPDRGGNDPQWVRQGTAKGGMEFDIFEKQTRWGPYRHDAGEHWDGYGKLHKSNGNFNIYTQPDKDGYITCGLLWLPGKVIYYDNGHEVLRWEDGRISNQPACLIFDNVCGGWDHDPMDDKALPQDLVVDYVRVWQRKDLASAVDGKMSVPSH